MNLKLWMRDLMRPVVCDIMGEIVNKIMSLFQKDT